MSSSSESETPDTPKKAKISKKKVYQKYKPEWEQEYNWIKRDKENNYNAICSICAVTFRIGGSGRGQITQHQETQKHKSREESKKQSSTLQKFLQPTLQLLVDAHVTAAELAQTFHTVKHNLSYNSTDCGNKLNKNLYTDSKVAGKIRLGRTKMEALVTEVLGPYAVGEVVKYLRDGDVYFCLQTDASNKKNIKLFPLVVQFFSVKDGIVNKIIDFYENADETADGMFGAIKKSIDFYKLSLNKVTGLSADNCNANFGINHSLYTNIRKEIPNLIKGKCHAHIVHNTVKHAMGCLDVDIENIVLKIYSHFSVSACRREELKTFVSNAEGVFHEIKRHIGTRWLSLLPAVDTLLLNWVPIRDYFINLDSDCPVLINKLLNLEDKQKCNVVELYLHFASHILNLFQKTIKCLEGNDISIIDVYNIMSFLKKELEQRKTDNFYGFETRVRLLKIKQLLPDLADTIINNLNNFIDKSLDYLIKWFDFGTNNLNSNLSYLSLTLKCITPPLDGLD